MPQMQAVDTSMGERARRVPPSPRIVINGVVILPQLDENWEPIRDMWVLPGRAVATTQELRDLAHARGVAFYLIN